MMGLVYKDFMLQRKTMRYYLFFILFYTVLDIMGAFNTSILSGLVVMIGVLVPMNSFAYDDQARWPSYAAALPGGRRDLVRSKYVFSLILLGAGAALVSGLILLLLTLDLAQGSPEEALLTALSCTLVGLLMVSAQLPLLFKFGPEKTRLIFILAIAVLFGVAFALEQLFGGRWHFSLPEWSGPAIAAAAVAIVAAAMLLSYKVSLRICTRKEF